MNLGGLLRRNLRYHWRGNLAILLGVAVATLVFTGSLLVGDSLRGSLRDLVQQQLGGIDNALVAGRFMRQQAADKLPGEAVCPAILVQGTVSTASLASGEDHAGRSVPRVTLLGVDGRFWNEKFWPGVQVPDTPGFWDSAELGVVLNATLADELGVKAGTPVAVHLQKASAIPRESLLGRGKPEETVDELVLKVRAVLPDASPGARFSLNPTPAIPRNAFVPLATLQQALRSPREANALPEKPINALLIQGGTPQALQGQLREALDLEDWGLMVLDPEQRFARLDRDHNGVLRRSEWQGRVPRRLAQQAQENVISKKAFVDYYQHLGYFPLESGRLFLEPAVVQAGMAAAQENHLRTAPTLVYLANSIAAGQEKIPYSLVAALDPGLSAPLGPFLPPGQGTGDLQDDEIILADWKESLLHVRPGEKIQLTYFRPEDQGQLSEQTTTFTLRGLVPLQGVADDPDLVPEFPGITDKQDMGAWDPSFPFDPQRVQPRDERYWQQYRTTPKAYVTLAAGQKRWSSRFGQLTSLRLAPAQPADLSQPAAAYRRSLREHLDPRDGGWVFTNVKEHGLQASAGGTDFGWLFVAFSCFLIAAALLLVGLLFRLNLERRAAEVGLLRATGYRQGTVRWLLLAEGGILAALGGLAGCAAAVLYAWLLLGLLRAWWPGALDRSFLRLHPVENYGLSYGIGYGAILVMSLLTIAWALRLLSRVAPSALLAGETTVADTGAARPAGRWLAWSQRGWIGKVRRRASEWAAGLMIVAALACALWGLWARDPEARAMSFFGSGFLLLLAGLAATWAVLRHRARTTSPHLGVGRLGVRNAGRNPVRSLLTTGLLASAAFLIIALECFHREPDKDYLDRKSGSGGFALLAESDVPITRDLNSAAVRDQLNFSDADQKKLADVSLTGFRVRSGDDASCLNLYQPRRPQLLGVPHGLVERDGFRFQSTAAQTPEEQDNPWRLLEAPVQGDAIPVFGETNTVVWMLNNHLGGELEVPDEQGRPVRLRLVGLLQDSIFQSGLLMSEANFLKLYPSQEGYNFFLIDVPPGRMDEVQTVLTRDLAGWGFAVTPTARRLESYLAVQNTYLATFQALGGLGLLLGALGLAVVLLRNVWERRGELALLRALGFRRSALGWLVVAENSFLLVLGLGVGVVAALIAVAPPLLTGTGEVPWLRLLGFLGLVLVVGFAAGAGAVMATVRAPLLEALRRE